MAHFGYQGAFWGGAVLFLLTLFLAPFCFEQNKEHLTAGTAFKLSEILAPLQLIRQHPHLRTLCGMEFMSNIANNFFSFFIVVIAIQNFHLQESLAVMLLTVEGIVFVGGLFSLGAVAEVVGYHRFYVIGLSLISFSLLSLSMTSTAMWLWLISVSLGLGLAMLHIANFMSFAKVGEQTSMNKISPLLALVGPAGGLLGGIVGALFGQQIGLQSLFAPIGLIFLILTVLIYRNLSFQQFLHDDFSSHPLQRQEP